MGFSMLLKISISFISINFIYGQCWKQAYYRGTGVPVSVCNDLLEQNGLLCYRRCIPGYKGAGPFCWSSCRKDFLDHGAICWKNSHIFGKCCCTIWSKNCCGKCPSGFTDDGCTCRRNVQSYIKRSYYRGLGIPLECATGLVYHNGLCYKKCRKEFSAFGSLCLSICPESFPTDCGGFCAINKEQCFQVILTLISNGVILAKSLSYLPINGSILDPVNFITATFGSIPSIKAFFLTSLLDLCPLR